MRRLSLALLFAPACAAAPIAPPPATAPPTAIPSVVASAQAVSPPVAPARNAARVGAPIDGRMALAVDCKARWVTAWSVGRDFVGRCGSGLEASAVFHIPASGPVRLAPEIFQDLSLDRARVITTLGITHMEGKDLDHLEADVTELDTRTGVSYRFRKTGKKWARVGVEFFSGDDFAPGTMVMIEGRGLVDFAKSDDESSFRYRDGKPGWIPVQGKIPNCAQPVARFSTLTIIGKELWGVGGACGQLVAQRWTIGGKDTSVVPLGGVPAPGVPATMQHLGDGWLYTGSLNSARFDGTRWEAFEPIEGRCGFDRAFSVSGRIWATACGEVLRLTGKRFSPIALPADLNKLVVSQTEVRIITEKGIFAFGADEAWHPVPLPGATAGGRIDDLAHSGDRWIAWVQSPDEGHAELFLEGASAPPLVITDPPPAVSPVAYVTPLRAGCGSPFAMLYKVSRVAPKDYAYPATREALKGEADLLAGRYSEVEAFGQRYLVARFTGPNAVNLLQKLARTVEARVPGSKPQLSCADRVPDGLPTTRDVIMR